MRSCKNFGLNLYLDVETRMRGRDLATVAAAERRWELNILSTAHSD